MKKSLVAVALAANVLAAPAAFAAPDLYTFSFSGPGISGSGTLTTVDESPSSLVTSATGTIFDSNGLSGGPYTITGMSLYAGADNLLFFPTEPYVSLGGISFTTDAGMDFNIGGGGAIPPFGYVVNNSQNDPGGSAENDISTLVITDVDVPEPTTMALLGAGLAGIGVIRRRTTA